MRVRMGWSGETESNVWQKISVELEEQDLDRIVMENELPGGIQANLPAIVCFKLLQNNAEILLLNKLVGLGYPTGKAAARIAVLTNENNEIANAVKKKLTPA